MSYNGRHDKDMEVHDIDLEVNTETEIECDEDILDVMPLLPLRGQLIFPYMVVPLDVGREKSVRAMEDAMIRDGNILLVAQKDANIDTPDEKDIYKIGTICEVKQLVKIPGAGVKVLFEGLSRAEISGFLQKEPFYRVKINRLKEDYGEGFEADALIRATMNQFEEYVKISRKIPPEVVASVSSITEPGRFADAIAAHLNLKFEESQKLLETISPADRLNMICDVLNKEIQILELERKIHMRVRKQMEKTQKEYYLREQLKAIQKELGDREDQISEIQSLKDKIKDAALPEEVEKKAMEELKRLEKMPPMAAEAVVVRNYLDWIINLPWNTRTEERIDLQIAQNILDEEHYGLEKVKERIIEYLAVRKLSNNLKGPILCLVGPPGVGKTSLAKSIAKAVGRNFVRFSLGGVRDEAEIRGHRRTYVGALPGRIIQSLRKAKSKNPLILLDEIDKMNMDFRGDPASALLEVLDPEENHSFGDHYLELTFDLSEVMFITTANVLHAIPSPLLDRMEVITLSGYTEEEKVQIASRFLVSKQLQENGLNSNSLQISENTIHKIIEEYTREAGVRDLERKIGTICRKSAKAVVEKKKRTIKVNKGNLHKFLGIPKYKQDEADKADKVGVATGLAWTQVGGEILAIEVATVKGKGGLILTGKLGDVMKESAQTGLTYIRSKASEFDIDVDFNEKYDIHVHVPEGAIPKDGPSAGITIVTAIVSALSGRPISGNVAMTGEVTLRGRVLPIGGVKEKVLAAHRAGIKTIILPSLNEKDIEEIPPDVKKGLNFVFVDNMDEVLKVALLTSKEKKSRAS